MEQHNLFNPALHDLLSKACRRGLPNGLGGRSVIISKAGENLVGRYVTDPSQPDREKLQIDNWGEVYRVCCPRCGDTRHRLYVSHYWGAYDKRTKTRNYSLYKCFNEDCTKFDGFYDDFMRRIDWTSNHIRNGEVRLAPIQTAPKAAEFTPISIDGNLTPVDELPANHPCTTYLESRGFSPSRLSKYFSVSWCDESPRELLKHRLVVPIYFNYNLVGYQARYIDAHGSGDCSNLYYCQWCKGRFKYDHDHRPNRCFHCGYSENTPKLVPKWYTCPGTQVGSVMLNYDAAKAWNYAIVMEGPMDVFRLGNEKNSQVPGPGMCSFGHKLTLNHKKLLPHWVNTGAVLLMYDDDVWDSTAKQSVELSHNFVHGVVPIPLMPNQDPADMKHHELWELINKVRKETGYNEKWLRN